MIFESLFGKSKKKGLGKERADQFKQAWLLANRSLLAAKSESQEADTQLEEVSIIKRAEQSMTEEKESYSAEARMVDQLAQKCLPIIDQIYSYSNRFMNEADVSSAHNTTFQRILEVVMQALSNGEPVRHLAAPEDFSPQETELFRKVAIIVSDYWSEDD